MYRVLRPFEYFEPTTVAEVVDILSRHGGKAKVLAGGMDLVPKMRRRDLSPEYIISLQRVKGLDYVNGDGKRGLQIGALASLRSVELSPAVARDYVSLYEAIHQIASVQVKTNGTLVGNLCVATPASDVATILMALGATLKVAGTGRVKDVPIEDFFTGPGRTIMAPNEIVTEVSVPKVLPGAGGAFLNLTRVKEDIAKVSAAVVITTANAVCQTAKIVLGAVAPTPLRCHQAEALLTGKKLESIDSELVAQLAADACTPITDIRSSAEYRKDMARVLTRRALEIALERAKS
jgi:carbon-monoxide dehydrogenase medium subunit